MGEISDDGLRCPPEELQERIPIILHAFSTFAVGGTQIGFVRLANYFGRRFRHIIISLDGDVSCASRIDDQVDCRVISMVMRKSRAISVTNLAHARRAIRENKADLLLTYNWGAVEWALANRWLPLCRHIHIEDVFSFDEISGQKLRRILFRRLAFAPTTLVVVPSRMLHRVATETWGFLPSRVLHLPNGVNVEKFAAGADPSMLPRLRSCRDELVIGTLSALRQDKRIDRVIRAVASLPPDIRASLVIGGDGPERPFLERLAREHGIADRTVFLGDVRAPERILGLFDIFALTSDMEQMPYAVIEAMSAGLPVIATDVGDVRTMVAPENGPFIIADASDSALVSTILELASDASRRRSVGYCNQEKARREFQADTMMKTYEALFRGTFR